MGLGFVTEKRKSMAAAWTAVAAVDAALSASRRAAILAAWLG